MVWPARSGAQGVTYHDGIPARSWPRCTPGRGCACRRPRTKDSACPTPRRSRAARRSSRRRTPAAERCWVMASGVLVGDEAFASTVVALLADDLRRRRPRGRAGGPGGEYHDLGDRRRLRSRAVESSLDVLPLRQTICSRTRRAIAAVSQPTRDTAAAPAPPARWSPRVGPRRSPGAGQVVLRVSSCGAPCSSSRAPRRTGPSSGRCPYASRAWRCSLSTCPARPRIEARRQRLVHARGTRGARREPAAPDHAFVAGTISACSK